MDVAVYLTSLNISSKLCNLGYAEQPNVVRVTLVANCVKKENSTQLLDSRYPGEISIHIEAVSDPNRTLPELN